MAMTAMASQSAAPKNDIPDIPEERRFVLCELAIEHYELCRLLIDHCIGPEESVVRGLVVRLRDVAETMAKTVNGTGDELNSALRGTHAGYFRVGCVDSAPATTGGAA